MGNINEIFQDYLTAHTEKEPINFQPLLEKYPELKAPLEKKIKAYQQILQTLQPEDPAKQESPLIGREIGGCKLLRVIGQGGMGVAYLGRQEKLNRNVVVKVLRPFAVDNQALKERFLRESRIIGRLNHPNIVPVFDVGEAEGSFYIVMKHVEGIPLSDLILRIAKTDRSSLRMKELLEMAFPDSPNKERMLVAKTPTEFFCEMVDQVADAVQHAHDDGVIHRDLKPSNIIIQPDGTPILLDFGLSHDEVEQNLTVTGEFLGTPVFSAPELFLKKKEGDLRQLDVYSLGVTLYELLTGYAPYEGENLFEIYNNIRKKEPFRPSQRWKKIPRDLETILLKCIEKDPGSRYKTVCEFSDDIKCFLNYEPITAKPTPLYGVIFRKIRRNPVPAALTLTLLMAVVFSTFTLVSHIKSKNRERLSEMRRLIGQTEQGVEWGYVTPEVLAKIEQAVSLSNNHIEALRAAAKAYCKTDQGEMCVKYNLKVLERVPLDQDAMINIGDSYVAQEKYDLALKHALSWIESDQTNWLPHLLSARVYLAQNQFDRARASIDRAIELEPNNEIIARMKGLICFQSNDEACAEEYFLKAWELNPGSSESAKALAGYYSLQRSSVTALPIIEKALTLNRFDPLLRKMYADNLLKVGRRSEALSEAVVLTTLRPETASNWITRADIEDELGLVSAALRSYELAETLSPDQITAEIKKTVCFYYINLNRLEKVKTCIEEGLRRYPENKDFELLHAYSDYLEKHYDEAFSQLSELVKVLPNDVIVLSLLSELYLKKGVTERAIEYANKALLLDRGSSIAIFALIKAYQKKGMGQKARSELKKAFKRGGEKYVVNELNLTFVAPFGWNKERERSVFSGTQELVEFKAPDEPPLMGRLQLRYQKAEPIDFEERLSKETFMHYLNSMSDSEDFKVNDLQTTFSEEDGQKIIEFRLYGVIDGEEGVGLGRWVVANGLFFQAMALLNNDAYFMYKDSVISSLGSLTIKNDPLPTVNRTNNY